MPRLMTIQEGRSTGWVRLQGIRHPLLLQPALEPLPRVPTLEDASLTEFYSSSTASYTSSSDGASSSEADEDEGAGGGAPPRPIDLRVPPLISVASITGPNTGTVAPLIIQFG